MNAANIYSKAVSPPSLEELARLEKNKTEQSLKEFQIKQVKDSWLAMNYTQSFLQALRERLIKLRQEVEQHVLSYADPSKDYILRSKSFEVALLSRILEMAETGNHNYNTISNK